MHPYFENCGQTAHAVSHDTASPQMKLLSRPHQHIAYIKTAVFKLHYPVVDRSPYRSPFRSTVTEITKIEARQPSGNLAEEGALGSGTSTPSTTEPLPPVSEVGAMIQGLERAGIGESPLQTVDALRRLLHCCWPTLQAVWLPWRPWQEAVLRARVCQLRTSSRVLQTVGSQPLPPRSCHMSALGARITCGHNSCPHFIPAMCQRWVVLHLQAQKRPRSSSRGARASAEAARRARPRPWCPAARAAPRTGGRPIRMRRPPAAAGPARQVSVARSLIAAYEGLIK